VIFYAPTAWHIDSGVPPKRHRGLGLLRMTKPESPPQQRSLFQEMPTIAKNKQTLFQDKAKTVHIENDVHADEIHKMEDDRMATATTDSTSSWFAVGDVVEVVQPDLRSYQVPAAGRGRYNNKSATTTDDNNNKALVFCPDSSLKYLILPVGLRGKVEKVYDPNSALSANLPIRVSFVKAKDDAATDIDGDTPQPPVDFQMHFAASELALVEQQQRT
jgi:hypothetical protein